MVAHDGLQRHFGGERLALLELGEHGRLMQPAAQVHRADAEHAAQQERQAPAVVMQLGRREHGVHAGGHERAEQDAGGQARRERAAGVADAARRHVLRDEDPGARHLTADGRALQDAQDQQRDRRQQANRGIGGQQAHQHRRHGHQQDGQREHLLAAEQVAEVRHDDPAQRACQVTGGENTVGLKLAQPVRHGRREEQLANHGGEEDENNEVVELERATQGGEGKRLVILSGQRAGGFAVLRAQSPDSTAGGRHEMTRMVNSHAKRATRMTWRGRPNG
ncbi:hypothetical protein D3C81_1315440 [compost metagenome]